MASWMVGVDIGGTKITAGLLSFKGELGLQETRPTGVEGGREAVFSHLKEAVQHLLSVIGKEGRGIKSIGIACAGLIDGGRGVVLTSPHIPWTSFPLKQMLETELGLPVFLMNDANAAALGEHIYGAGKGMEDLVYVTVSTGIGIGLILRGKLYTGFQGLAGEAGHTTIEARGPLCECGNRGCWEALASGSAIAREARLGLAQDIPSSLKEVNKLEDITAEIVHRAAQGGDGLALGIIQRAARYFGVGLANLVNLFNPQLIIVGGGVAKMGELFLGPAEAEMRRRAYVFTASPARLVPASLGDRAALYGLLAQLQQGSKEIDPGKQEG